jgi:hypothetical protein
MLTTNTLKINLVLFTLFLSPITVSVDAKTSSGKATQTEISLVDGITLGKKGDFRLCRFPRASFRIN